MRPLWGEIAKLVGYPVPMPALELYLEDAELDNFSLRMDWSYNETTLQLGVLITPYLRVVPPTLTHTLLAPDFRQERVTNLTEAPSPERLERVLRAPNTKQQVPFVDGPSETPIYDTFQALTLINALTKILRTP